MTQIEISTHINAPIEKCFNLSRSIDLHLDSMKHSREQSIAGRTGGLIELGETVTWRARHFGIWQTLTSKIIELDFPNSFTDMMVKGPFKSLRHEHLFYAINNQTLMKDMFIFESPFGVLGELANALFLGQYMTTLLEKRNIIIKETAEKITD